MSEEKAVYDPIHRPANPLSRDVAHLQNDVRELRGKLSSLVDQFNALVKGQDELSEMVHNLMAATAPEVQDEFAELRRQRDQDRYWMDGLDKRIDLIVQRLNAEQREGHLASAALERIATALETICDGITGISVILDSVQERDGDGTWAIRTLPYGVK